jgi:hypothetical protein
MVNFGSWSRQIGSTGNNMTALRDVNRIKRTGRIQRHYVTRICSAIALVLSGACAPSTALAQNTILLRDVTRQTGITFQHTDGSSGQRYIMETVSAGLALFDHDSDGDVDAVILNSRQAPTILRNDSPTGNHWLQIRLRGTQSNRDGVGARVTVTAGNLR